MKSGDFGLTTFRRKLPSALMTTGIAGLAGASLGGPTGAVVSATLTAGINSPSLVKAMKADDKQEERKRLLIEQALKDANFSEELTIPIKSAEDLAKESYADAIKKYLGKLEEDMNRKLIESPDFVVTTNNVIDRDEDGSMSIQAFDSLI